MKTLTVAIIILILCGIFYSYNSKEQKTIALINAADKGNVEEVKKLILQGACINCYEFEDTTALLAATLHNKADVINILLDNGADINLISHTHTPLFGAATAGQIQAFKALRDRGGKLNIQREQDKEFLLNESKSHRNIELNKLIEEEINKESSLHSG